MEAINFKRADLERSLIEIALEKPEVNYMNLFNLLAKRKEVCKAYYDSRGDEKDAYVNVLAQINRDIIKLMSLHTLD